MRNLAEPGQRFRAAAPNHPEALLEEPQAFQAVGGKIKRSTRVSNVKAKSTQKLKCKGKELPKAKVYRNKPPQVKM